MDDLGRAWKTRDDVLGIETFQLQRNDPTYGGSYQLASNPYITGSESSMGWTRTALDALGRVVGVSRFDGSSKPSPWGGNSGGTGTVATSYSGYQRTITDEAGVTRTFADDALGRLAQVTEAGAYTTTYTYNAGDKLTGVNQGGRTRIFSYNSLGLLLSATNPENGTINYSYDANGNMVKRVDARGVITCFGVLSGSNCDFSNFQGYNRFNQALRTQYSDGTPNVTNTYGTSPGQCGVSVGRVCSVANGVSTSTYTYNALGQITNSTQSTTGDPLRSFSYLYKLNDQLAKITYPSNRVVEYGFDSGGRVTRVANGDLISSSSSYASNIQYAPHGGVSSLKAGTTPSLLNGILETRVYNGRLQPSQIQIQGGVLTLAFGYGGSNNNGNILTQDIYQNFSGTPSSQFRYAYDSLNRLAVAASNPNQTLTASTVCNGISSTWCQQNGYDQWGNRWMPLATGLPGVSGEVPQSTGAFNTSNRISALTYDNAGNVTNFNGVRTATYDAENRQVSVRPSNNEPTVYAYDGQGRRVRKTTCPTGTVTCATAVSGAVITTFVYDAMGQLAAEYGGPAVTDTGTRYLFSDHLGSTRMVMKADGTVDKTYDYLPFGEEIGGSYPGSAAVRGTQRLEFTGKERDAESGLDYFGARYFSSYQGRFTSADEWAGGIVDPFTGGAVGTPGPLPYADITDPQTINKYAYVRNNPMRYTDPDGHVIDTLLDVAFIGYDIYKIATEGGSKGNYAALAADVGAALLPGVTGAGMAVRGAGKAAHVVETAVHGAEAGVHVAEAGKVGYVGTEGVQKTITLSRKTHGEAAEHAADAIAAGQPNILTINRPGAPANREAAIGGRAKVPNKQLDEYPPAMFKEGGQGASVRPINPRDNMSAGACIGNACRGLPDNSRIKIEVRD